MPILLAALGTLGADLAGQRPDSTRPDSVRWEADLARGETLARQTGKPLLLVFR